MEEPAQDVVIVGGGIVGAATAYFLSKRGISSTIIERSGIASCASGKSGGFLGGGWGDSITSELHTKGFDLHVQLAKELGIESFRRIETLQVSPGTRRVQGLSRSWLRKETTSCSLMDDETAQVTPFELTTKLVEASGCDVVIGTVTNASLDQTGDVIELSVDGEIKRASTVVFATGPWAVQLDEWFGISVPMEGIWSTSAVFQPDAPLSDPAALFCHEDENNCHLEVYPRPNGEVYVCGLGGSRHVQPEEIKALTPEQVVPVAHRVEAATKSLQRMTTVADGGLPPMASQACMRPCPRDGVPLIGQVPVAEAAKARVLVAAGHNCWGILWGPITGKAVSEIVAQGTCECVNLSAFDPMRFTRHSKGVSRNRGRHQQEVEVGEQW